MSGFSIRPSNFAANTDDTVAEPVTPAAAAPVATPSRQWSDRQQAIFNFITHGRGSAVVIAVAGAGKTTTIVEAANRLPESLSCAFVAFNKSIADELRSRLPRHVRAQTLNGMGFSAWLRHLGCRYDAVKIDANKSRRLCEELVPAQHYGRFAKSMPRLIGLAKSIGLIPRPVTDAPDGRRYQSPMVEDTDAAWLDIVDTFNLDFDIDLDNDGHTSLLCGYARKILERSIHLAQADPWRGERACDNRSTDQDKRPLLDFDDQLYMPVICGSRFWQHDFIFVDEAQDLNKVQRTMLRRALRPSGRLIAVGDPWQAIYAFRGATSNSMAMVEKDFHAIQLPLTISYRCPKAVVTEAHNWVSHIESHSAAPEGTVATWTSYSADQFRQTDAILCRNTRPLIELAFNLLRESVPCKVRGRDIGAGLVALVNKFKLSDQSLDNFSVRLHQWAAARIQRLLDDKKD
ncbi:MAG TPA: UvrD-helicase domain-containing protein, partial [Phycisphaerae bacterium]|nr:UvrD-helicase domain-containing protein [Phycisphaerae bacterium]